MVIKNRGTIFIRVLSLLCPNKWPLSYSSVKMSLFVGHLGLINSA